MTTWLQPPPPTRSPRWVRSATSTSSAERRPARTPRSTRSWRRATSTSSTATSTPCTTSTWPTARNEITAMIGPSGCGKSTVLRCLNRMNDLVDRSARRGRGALPRPGHLREERRPDRRTHAHRHGLPEAQPVPQVDLRQHRLRPPGHRHEGRQHGRPRRGGAARRRALGRGQGQAQAVGVRPLRRPAAAPLHRADDRHQARRDPDGRAVLGARPDRHGPGRGPDAASCATSTRSSWSRTTCSRRPASPTARRSSPPAPTRRPATARACSWSTTSPRRSSPTPNDKRTEDYISGRFG